MDNKSGRLNVKSCQVIWHFVLFQPLFLLKIAGKPIKKHDFLVLTRLND